MDSLHSLASSIQSKLLFLQTLPKKTKLQQLERLLSFVRCFAVKGVQGIAGLLSYKSDIQPSDKPSKAKPKKKSTNATSFQDTDTDLPVVFKVGCEVNLCIEHERDVLLALNSIRDWCPHFVGCLGYLNVPIAQDFIESEKQQDSDDEEDLFERRCSEKEEEPKILPGTLRLWDNSEEVVNGSMILLEYIGDKTCNQTYAYLPSLASLAL